MKKCLIAGTYSGVGKTTLTLALMEGLKAKGYTVQPYKVGPDYIDTAYHTKVAGRVSRNLDGYMLEEEKLKYLFNRSMEGADIAVVEGVMGLYDGKGIKVDECSSGSMATLLDLPVILVIDASSMGASSAAMVMGYQKIDPRVRIVGVIANRVRTKGHFQLVKESIEHYCHIPVIGYFPPEEGIELPSRHLGLVPSSELDALETKFHKLGEMASQTIDLEQLVALAEGEAVESKFVPVTGASKRRQVMAVALDAAFNFYYEDNLELLQDLGVELVYFSPLKDTQLPPCDGIYIGGGFPEMFGQQLQANVAMRQALKEAHQQQMPIYAECGGLMYLGEYLLDPEGNRFEMVGILEGYSEMTKGLQRFGYCYGEALEETLLSEKGEILRGHEFHHSHFITKEKAAYRMRRGLGSEESWEGGYVKGNTLASYLHLHFYGHIEAVTRWLQFAHHEQGGKRCD